MSESSPSFPSRTDAVLTWVLRGLAALAGALVLLIFAFVALESLPALREIGVLRFLSDSSWHPSEGLYKLAPMLWGTLFTAAGAFLLATPIGILSAIFCHLYAPPPIAWLYRRLLELLAGIPSVVYGFWGLVVLVPLIARIEPPGASLLAAVLILTLMILPTLALSVDASFAAVPAHYHQGAAALGLSPWATLRGVILPSARSGIFTAIILQTGRAIGETMAVLMVCGNVVQTPTGLFQPIRTLAANIALEMSYALGSHRSALFVSGLLLMGLSAALVAAAEWISRGRIYG